MKLLNIILLDFAFSSKIYGNIFSDSHQVIETMWVPAAKGPDESTSCIFVEHSEFFSGTTMVKRTFTEVSTRIKWELISGTRTELDIRYLKDKSKEENPDHVELHAKPIRNFKKNGEMTIILDPFEHMKREGSLQDFEE